MAAFAQLFSLMVGAMVVPLATILLIVADTWAGRLFAVAVFCVAGTIALALFGRDPTRPRRLRLAAGLGCVGLGLLVAIAWRAPPGVTVASARVSHLPPESGGRYRLAPTHLVPEVDQLMLGFSIMPLLDPLLTFREAGQLKASTREIYRDLEGDENFRAVGSVMGLTYTDLLGGETSNHAYLYVPLGLDRSKPAPVLVFLHGHGGNFRAYLWLLSNVADRLNFIVVAPTGGVGRWTIDETTTRVPAALAAARRVVAVDPKQIHAIGLSNGGQAVSQLLANSRGDYRSFVFLSPVFREESMRALANATVKDNAFVFVITGVLDRRVPFSYVENNVRTIRATGADVTFEPMENADHFLIFVEREKVLTKLERWLKSTR